MGIGNFILSLIHAVESQTAGSSLLIDTGERAQAGQELDLCKQYLTALNKVIEGVPCRNALSTSTPQTSEAAANDASSTVRVRARFLVNMKEASCHQQTNSIK